MESGDLRVFESVARLGSLTKAAAELHTVQSNVTARIRLLEEELGVEVFRRHSRGVALTAAGEKLLPFAVQIQQILNEAGRSVLDGDAPRGPLRIGSLETVTALRLPQVLARYLRRYPEVSLTVVTGTTCSLLEEVCAWRLDAAFVAGPVKHPDVSETLAWMEELVLVTHPGVASLDEALRSDRELTTIVFRKGCSYREHLERLIEERGLRATRELEFGTVDGIIGCAAAGLGVSLMPRRVAEHARKSVEIGIHALPRDRALAPTVVVQRRDAPGSAALRKLVECVRE